jgi:hypothetical protein
MNKLLFILPLFWTINSYAYSTGLPMPPLTLSSGSITVTATGSSSVTVTSYAGKVPFLSFRKDYSVTPVTTGSYSQLVASTSVASSSIEIFDSSGQPLYLAFGGSGSEVNKVLDYPGGNGLIPLLIPAGTRLSIIAVTATASSGELDINFYQ